jgi:uncharacterized membrane protein YesL
MIIIIVMIIIIMITIIIMYKVHYDCDIMCHVQSTRLLCACNDHFPVQCRSCF